MNAGTVLIIIGVILIIVAGISSRKQIREKGFEGYSSEELPGGGLIVKKSTSFISLLGYLLLASGIILFLLIKIKI